MSARRPFGLLLCASLLAASGPARGEPSASLPPANEPLRGLGGVRPPPLHLEYFQYGVAIVAETNLDPGAVCAPESGKAAPCILGGAGGLAIRGGYRSAGPWYVGGAYQFAKMDSSNLYRLGIFQQLRFEVRYLPDLGTRAAPYASWGIGALAYGNEWGVETGGGLLFGGLGVEIELSRVALLGFGLVYRPMLIAGWTDTAGAVRATGVAHFLGAEFQFELRSEIGRR